MKNKLTITIIAFLLLVPLRLPISILFIHFFEWIIGLTTSGEIIPKDTLATNIIVTKLVYNIVISVLFTINIEMLSREKMGRNARTKIYGEDVEIQPIYWWIVPIVIMLIIFICIDAVSVYNIFFI